MWPSGMIDLVFSIYQRAYEANVNKPTAMRQFKQHIRLADVRTS
jgi:hypothetical protein